MTEIRKLTNFRLAHHKGAGQSQGDQITYFWTMILSIVVGVLGFAFHLAKVLTDTGQISLERILVFAPVFAPLLFCDLGLLGLLVVSQSERSGVTSGT